jgi:2-polyprenyl-3-methyl-5-hydroxy-6-metoxy-1,4-benzoquinol methylase
MPDTETICVLDLIEFLDAGAGRRLLDEAWSLLRPGGRLIVVVPNREALRDGSRTLAHDRRTLTRLVRGWGDPRLLGDQPFLWLAVELRKPRPGPPVLPAVKRDRLRATARLCRGRVIELGCGEGHLTRAIADRGLDVVGVDHSERKIRTARRLYPDLSFRISDIRRLGGLDAIFDTVVLAEVLEHVDEPAGDDFLAGAWELLRPGGRLVVSVPNEDLVPHRNHVREFDHRSLKRLLRPLGKVRAAVDQPYRWLLMTVEKPG